MAFDQEHLVGIFIQQLLHHSAKVGQIARLVRRNRCRAGGESHSLDVDHRRQRPHFGDLADLTQAELAPCLVRFQRRQFALQRRVVVLGRNHDALLRFRQVADDHHFFRLQIVDQDDLAAPVVIGGTAQHAPRRVTDRHHLGAILAFDDGPGRPVAERFRPHARAGLTDHRIVVFQHLVGPVRTQHDHAVAGVRHDAAILFLVIGGFDDRTDCQRAQDQQARLFQIRQTRLLAFGQRHRSGGEFFGRHAGVVFGDQRFGHRADQILGVCRGDGKAAAVFGRRCRDRFRRR